MEINKIETLRSNNMKLKRIIGSMSFMLGWAFGRLHRDAVNPDDLSELDDAFQKAHQLVNEATALYEE